MWISNITKINQDQDEVYVDFINSETQDAELGYIFKGITDKETLYNQIQARLDYHEKRDAFKNEVSLGIIDPKTTSITHDFQVSKEKLLQYTRAINLGLVSEEDEGYLAALEDAQSKFSLDFLKLI